MMGNGYFGYGDNWSDMPDYMQNMMRNYYGGSSFLWQFAGILDFLLKILFIVLLIAVIRWVWMKGGK